MSSMCSSTSSVTLNISFSESSIKVFSDFFAFTAFREILTQRSVTGGGGGGAEEEKESEGRKGKEKKEGRRRKKLEEEK